MEMRILPHPKGLGSAWHEALARDKAQGLGQPSQGLGDAGSGCDNQLSHRELNCVCIQGDLCRGRPTPHLLWALSAGRKCSSTDMLPPDLSRTQRTAVEDTLETRVNFILNISVP